MCRCTPIFLSMELSFQVLVLSPFPLGKQLFFFLEPLCSAQDLSKTGGTGSDRYKTNIVPPQSSSSVETIAIVTPKELMSTCCDRGSIIQQSVEVIPTFSSKSEQHVKEKTNDICTDLLTTGKEPSRHTGMNPVTSNKSLNN